MWSPYFTDSLAFFGYPQLATLYGTEGKPTCFFEYGSKISGLSLDINTVYCEFHAHLGRKKLCGISRENIYKTWLGL